MYILRSISPFTISTICGCSSGSPPGNETIGTPHSSTAAKHSSGLSCFFRMCGGYCTLPQPAQARLQRKSGSSMSTSGYFFCPLSLFLSTYVATVHICEMGTPIVETSCEYCGDCSRSGRAFHGPLVSGQCQEREIIAIHVIGQVKDPWESCAGVERLARCAFASGFIPFA